MALDLFRVIDGVAIQLDDLSDEAHILIGDGAPLGTTGRTADAPVGSIWMQTDAETDKLNLYWKHVDTDAATDWVQAATKEYVDNTVSGISWREPVVVMDDTSTTIPVGVAGNPILVDGVSIVDGERVLFTAITGSPAFNNVWIYDQASGVFVEDTNAETDGDAILVNEGSHADEQWIYDGTNWIQFGGAGSATELGNIRDYIGKPGPGNIFPQYQSNNLIADNDDLTRAASLLDHASGDLQYTSNNILTVFTASADELPTGSPPDFAGDTGDDLTEALSLIDSQFGDGLITNISNFYPLTDEMQWNAAGTLTITDALNALNNVIDNRTYTNSYIVGPSGTTISDSLELIDLELGDLNTAGSWTTGGLVSQANLATNTVQENIDALNQAAGDQIEQNYENTVAITASVQTELESGTLADTEASEVLWHVQIRSTGTSANRRGFLVHAITEPGSNTADWNRSSVVRLGATVGNLGIVVDVSGGNWTFTMNPAQNVTATLKRYSYSYLA